MGLIRILAADNKPIIFKHLSLEEGLSQNTVFCIMQDSKGFMWFGTQDGLNKYDGYNFTVYKPNPDVPNSLSEGEARTLFEDKTGLIWIGTSNRGVNKFDPKTERFYRYRFSPNDPRGTQNGNITTITQDKEGNIWIGTFGGGITKIIREKNRERFIHYRSNPKNPGDQRSLVSNLINRIYVDHTGTIWIGTAKGLQRYNRQTDHFERYAFHQTKPHDLTFYPITCITEDHLGLLWIGTLERGLHVMNKETGQFDTYRFDARKPGSLSSDYITSICEDYAGVMWIGTAYGLNRFNSETRTFTRYLNDRNDPFSLSSNGINVIYQDSSHILWIGIENEGLNKYDRSDKFDLYRSEPTNPNSMSEDFVYSVCKDRRGDLWVGHGTTGLDLLNGQTGKWTYFQKHPYRNNSLSYNMVRAICEDSRGDIWIGTPNGLNKFNPKTQTFSLYFKDHNIRVIYEDLFSRVLWIGTDGKGLIRFNLENGNYTLYQYRANQPTSLGENSITAICQSRVEPGIYWIGTRDNGVNRFDSKTERFTRFIADPDDPQGLSGNLVQSIYEDRRGTLWIGTFGGGLNKLIRKTDKGGVFFKFAHFTERNGLPNNAIYGILEDEKGHLWLSTNKGLSRFDPETGTCKNYNTNDGLQSNEFNGGAYFKSVSGEMFFGGLKGLNSFYPSRLNDNPHVPPIVITEFTLMNRRVPVTPHSPGSPLKYSISWTDKLTLTFRENVFSFGFTALDFTIPGKNQYAYMLENYDENWIYTDAKRRFASYAKVKPGTYTFRVKGSNNDGIWNEVGASIQVTIKPPFYQKDWFYLLLGVLVLGLFFIGYKKRVNNIRIIAELRTAHDAQMSIMPQADPHVKGFDVSGICVPANEVGGDFFDYIWLNEEKSKFGIAIGDVSGKAMNSAMTAVMTSGMIYLGADDSTSVKEILKRVNKPLYFKTGKKVFTALCLASLDIENRVITFTNAGLTEPILRSGHSVSKLKGRGKKLPLGLKPDTDYLETTHQLKSGDVIVLFTDGVPESKNTLNEFYEYHTLMELIKHLDVSELSAKQIKMKIIDDVKRFTQGAPQHDDMTVIVVKVL
ncbi:MAG: two-component regulator propeller domain-containing protein [Candidatus Omnitrophota bacterium]